MLFRSAGAQVVGRAFDVETSDLDAGEEAGDDEGGADEITGVVGAEVGTARAGDEDRWCDAVRELSAAASCLP